MASGCDDEVDAEAVLHGACGDLATDVEVGPAQAGRSRVEQPVEDGPPLQLHDPARAIAWVDRVSLGNSARSTTTTSCPDLASSIAVAAPAQRAPTTTSAFSTRGFRASEGGTSPSRPDCATGRCQAWNRPGPLMERSCTDPDRISHLSEPTAPLALTAGRAQGRRTDRTGTRCSKPDGSRAAEVEGVSTDGSVLIATNPDGVGGLDEEIRGQRTEAAVGTLPMRRDRAAVQEQPGVDRQHGDHDDGDRTVRCRPATAASPALHRPHSCDPMHGAVLQAAVPWRSDPLSSSCAPVIAGRVRR